jgi:uncharacterized protein YhaN
MTPQKFSTYQSECYNPGSPKPESQSSPFKTFPKNLIITAIPELVSIVKNSSDPLKLTVSSRKRKAKDNSEDNPVDKSVSKKKKMDQETREMFAEMRNEMRAMGQRMEEKMDSSAASMKKDVGEQLAEMKVAEQFTTLTSKVNGLQAALERSEHDKAANEERLGKVEEGLENVNQLIQEKFSAAGCSSRHCV